MKKIFIPLLVAFLLAGCTIPLVSKKNSGLRVTSTPQATVSLDGEQLGTSPLVRDKLKPGKYQLQLIPEEGQPWESNITLNEKLQTVVDRAFGATDQESEGYIMTLEKIGAEEETQLTVISIPDRAIARLDGQPKGFTPTSTTVSTAGNHEVTVTSAGYKEKRIPIQIPQGHRLLLTVQLARAPLLPSSEGSTEAELATPSATSEASSTESATVKPYVEILDTPTGWLRVRSEPTTAKDNEITKVNPGETYQFIEANESGWYKIKLPNNKEGWISGQYAKLYR